MIYKLKIILLILASGFILLFFACDDQPRQKKQSVSNVVSGKISKPVIQNKILKDSNKDIKSSNKISSPRVKPVDKKDQETSEQKLETPKPEHYDSQGKIDPFRPLIQEKSEEYKPIADNRPARILTPLEKIELSQIRLVAVIIMKDKQIEMVEDANGKGYEIAIGTYIGKKQGKVSEIKNSSITITELVRDYKGRIKEQVQEIKLHKTDDEG